MDACHYSIEYVFDKVKLEVVRLIPKYRLRNDL